MRRSHPVVTHRLAKLCLTLVVGLIIGQAQHVLAQCNQVSFQIAVAPDNQTTLPLYWFLQSSCPANPRLCGSSPTSPDRIELPAGTTPQQKCQKLVQDIASRCTGPGSAGFTIVSQDCSSVTPGFVVSDPSCPTSTSQVLALGISNQSSILSTNQDVWQLDYERDLITPRCSAGSSTMSVIKGNPTGEPFVAGSQAASVVMVVDTRGSQGPIISQQQATKGLNAVQVVSNLTSAVNAQLSQIQSPVRCDAQGRAVRCVVSSGGAASDQFTGVPATFQTNDTGLSRGAISGPTSVVNALLASVDKPGASCPTFSQCNVVNAVAAVPAMSVWPFATLAGMLAFAGSWFTRRRAARSRWTS